MLAFGMVAALLEAKNSGKGQVVDVAMVDGAASLMTMTHAFKVAGLWKEERGVNMLDSGAHFYEVYETKDGGFMAVGAIERKFYDELLYGLGLNLADLPDQMDREKWAETKETFKKIFKTKTRDEWTAIFEDRDACTTPVMAPFEAPEHRHATARDIFVEVDGVTQPAPVPRFSVTPAEISKPASYPGQDTVDALARWGVDAGRIAALQASGAVQ